MKSTFTFLLLSLLLIFLLVELTCGLPPSFTDPRTCSQTWGDSCNSTTLNDAFNSSWNGTHDLGCVGTQEIGPTEPLRVEEVYLNATSVLLGDYINATCQFYGGKDAGMYDTEEYIFYYNGSNWMELKHWTDEDDPASVKNRTVTFKPNNTVGTHWIRCSARFNVIITQHCAMYDGSGDMGTRDNDDVNFTVTDRLKYTSWTLTNYTTGETIEDGTILHRNDKINASAHWNKDLTEANISHNGTGYFDNYTVPITGNWTNYTLNLSDTTKFNNTGPIGVSYIWAKDTFGLENYTYPSKHFYLYGESKLDQMTVNATTVYNNTAVKIDCRVIDYHTDDEIQDYNVSFFENGNFLHTQPTNTTGWATYSHTLTATQFPQDIDLKCNITDQPDLYYNASSENSNESTVKVIDPKNLMDCSVLDQEGATYNLTKDITNSDASPCMNITAQNVILDCQGNIIDRNDTYGGDGIHSNQFNTTIKNCVLTDWNYGITYTANNGTIQNVSSINNTYGIHLDSSNYNTLTNIIVNNNTYPVYLINSENNKLTNITANYNTYGIQLDSNAKYNTFTEITVFGSAKEAGLVVKNDCNYNTLTDITINYCKNGLEISGSHNNTFTEIKVINNVQGIYLTSSPSYNNITNSSIYDNTNDYYFSDASLINYFRNTNFTDERTIGFADTSSWFNYNNASSNGIWLKNNISSTNTITRKLINWDKALLIWNDTPDSAVTARYNITGLYANGIYQIYNNSEVTHTLKTDSSGSLSFTIYLGSEHEIKVEQEGFSEVEEITLNDTIIYNGTSVQAFCRIVDNTSSVPIKDYNVSFYRDENFLGWSLTNSSGHANISFTDTTTNPPQNYTIKCNITDEPSLGYNVSEINSKNTTLQVIDLHIFVIADPTTANIGDNVEILANISGNASVITSVYFNITYMNISDDGKLFQTYEDGNMSHKQSFSSTEHEYTKSGKVKSSGNYFVDVTVYGERVKSNTTTFNVSFGTPVISFISPNYRIMTNQTFNFTVNVSSVSGDIWYTNLTISITNATRINVSTGQSYSLENLYNISSGTSDIIEWSLKSSYSGLTRITLNVTPQNGSFATDDSIHDVLYPIIEAPTPTNVNINEIITTKIIGNVTDVDSINFSVFIPYTSDIMNFSSYYVRNETESQCTGEVLASGRLTLGVDYGGNATCLGNDCNETIDNTTSSMLLGFGAPNLIIMLDSEQTIERISILWKHAFNTTPIYNATIYYNSSGNWVTTSFLSGLIPPDNYGYTNITGFTPFKTNAFLMNNTANLQTEIDEFEAYGIPGKVGLCYVYEYNFSDVTRSGTYYFNSTTKTKEAIVKQSSSFFAYYGYPQIEIDADSLMYKTIDSKYNTTIIAYNGDLRNLTVNLTISNTSVVQNQTPTETLLRNIPEILSGDQVTIIFNLTAMNDGRTNTTVWVNSTTNEGYYNQSGVFPINVTSEAGDPPKVANFWFSYIGTNTNKANLFTAFTIHANVSDDIQMGQVLANITYPSPGNENFNLTFETGDKDPGWHIWNYIFGGGDNLNATGNYTVMIIARDFGGKENVSGEYGGYPKYMTFEVFNDYTLNLTSEHNLYMRGENVRVQASGVNDKVAENVNWTVNITKINQRHTENNLTTTYNYQIKSNDPEGNYSIFVINATKDGNHGNGTWYFNVSRNFSIGVNVEDSDSRGISLFIDVDLYNARGNSHLSFVDANITCQNKSGVYLTYPLTFTDGHADFDGKCATPDAYKRDYHITINVSDQYNNYGFYNNTFTTEEQEREETDGDGRGPAPSPGPSCVPEADYETNCTDEKDNDCDGATDCADPDCFDFPACIEKIPDFIFNMTTEIEIKQGEDGKVGGTMKNTGNVQLLLKSSVDIEKDCCSVDISPSFTVPQKTTRGFNATIHVNTSTEPGEYLLNFKLNYLALQNSQPVKVIVKENEIISYILKTMTSELPRIISEINEYKDVGIDVSHLEYRISNIQELIQNANEAVQQDNLELLKQYNDEIRSDVEYINAEKERLALQKLIYENKWNITYGIIIGIVSVYLIIQVIAPFVRLSHEIVKLTFDKTALTQSRIKAEKQYFLRKIDEQTFRRIVTSKHSQILKLSSTVDLKKQQRIDLVKKRLNPLSLGEHIKKKLSKKKSK